MCFRGITKHWICTDLALQRSCVCTRFWEGSSWPFNEQECNVICKRMRNSTFQNRIKISLNVWGLKLQRITERNQIKIVWYKILYLCTLQQVKNIKQAQPIQSNEEQIKSKTKEEAIVKSGIAKKENQQPNRKQQNFERLADEWGHTHTYIMCGLNTKCSQ